jgi:hypothetical protein
MEAGEARSAARREFDAVGGDDRAARAAADKQVALTEMKAIAEENMSSCARLNTCCNGQSIGIAAKSRPRFSSVRASC